MLETEIKNLTNAIKELTAVMSSATQEIKEDAKPEAVKWMKSQADINHKFMNFYSASTWLDELFN